MPKFEVYHQELFPPIYKWQVLSFMRTAWPSIFTGEDPYLSEPYPPEHEPVHFVLAEGECLISYASILKILLTHQDRQYQVYGFGNMFTFPPYQDRGFGSKVLNGATTFIRESGVDVAILFCNPRLEQFYAACGWEISYSPTLIGSREAPERYEELRMMLYLSEKSIQQKNDFDQQPLFVQWPW